MSSNKAWRLANPLNRSWSEMRRRCNNPAADAYARYGGRGIRVCERWQGSFAAFVEDMGPRPPGMSLDRIDNNGNYEPGNCRWSTPVQQNRNKRNNTWVEVDGERMCLKEACAKLGTDYHRVRRRVLAGESFEAAVSRPPNYSGHRDPLAACAAP